MQDKNGYPKKINSARPDSQPSKHPSSRGDMNILSHIENETNKLNT